MLHLTFPRATAATAAVVLLAACGADDPGSPGQTEAPTATPTPTAAASPTTAAASPESSETETIELRSGDPAVELDEGRYEFILDQRTITVTLPAASTVEATATTEGATDTLVLRDGETAYAGVLPVDHVRSGSPDGPSTPAPPGIEGMEELLGGSDEVTALERTTVGEHEALRFDVTDADGAPLLGAGDDPAAGPVTGAERVWLIQTFYGSWWAVTVTLDDDGAPVHELDVGGIELA